MHSFLLRPAIVFLLLQGSFAGAQVKFSASISPAQIGKDEYAQLRLMVENAREVEQILPPRLKDFIILSRPSQESGMSVVNGVVKRYIALSFVIKPRAVGNFSIPPALAKVDGTEYKSNAVSLKVTPTGTGNSQGGSGFTSPFAGIDPFAEPSPPSYYRDYILGKGENPQEKIQKNMFVKLEVDKTSCYVGEPVVASYKLYTRLKSESNMTKNPSFNGFSVIDLQQPDKMNYHIERSGGKEYNVYIIRKVQLYPLLPGNLELGTAEIENNVRFIKAAYANQQPDVFSDMFRDFAGAGIPAEGMEEHKVSLQNKPVTILVKPLPDASRPAGFKGAVGDFRILAKVEKGQFSSDDAGRMAIIISGEGNLQLVNAPEMTWPAGLEGFEPKATDDLYKNTVPVSGRKIFEFPFTAERPGSYTIPPVEFSYFDPRELKYKTITTDPLSITVSKGSGKPKETPATDEKKATGSYLSRFFHNRLRVVSLLAILIIIGLLIWLRRENKKEKHKGEPVPATSTGSSSAEEMLPAPENHFASARDHLHAGDARSFYAELNRAFKHYLSGKLSIPPEALNKKTISEQLDRRGVGHETSLQLQQLMDEMEWELYTPFAENEKMKGIYDRANELVQLLNSYQG